MKSLNEESGYIIFIVLVLILIISLSVLSVFQKVSFWKEEQMQLLKYAEEKSYLSAGLMVVQKSGLKKSCIIKNKDADLKCSLIISQHRIQYGFLPVQSDVCVKSAGNMMQIWMTEIRLDHSYMKLKAGLLFPRLDSSVKCRHDLAYSGGSIISWQIGVL